MPIIDSRLHIPGKFIIHETEHWVINHHLANVLPGYLILGSKAPVDSLADLPTAALHEFGELLARAQSILQTQLDPRTYLRKPLRSLFGLAHSLPLDSGLRLGRTVVPGRPSLSSA